MKLSIVTISYNNLLGVKRTAENVLSQVWNDYEWIVIDGGSTDGTKEYLTSLEKQPDYWCSEKDNGIYDAQNKGIRIAKGEYVCCMNAGDTFCENTTLQKVFAKNPKADVIYGDWKRIYPNGEETCRAPKVMPPYFFFYKGKNICHQAMFVKTKLLQESGFDLSYRIYADWAKWRQFMYEKRSFEYVPVTICNFEANMGTCEQDTVLRKTEYKKLADEIPPEVHKAIIEMNCDIDVALIGFYPSNNGTIIWRLNYLKKVLDANGYNSIVLTSEDQYDNVLNIIRRAKRIILCRPSMDGFGNAVIRFCINEDKPFIIDIDDALFHDNTQNDGCFMSNNVTHDMITSGYNNIADCYHFAEFMTVSTKKIQEILLDKYGIKSILLPNQIDISLCRKIQNKEHTGLKLLYASGTATHLHDLSTIFLDLLSFMKRHQDVTLTILGDSIDKEHILWSKNRVRNIPYMDFNSMLNVYAEHDLVLVPLAQGEFNDAKSNIKYIEGGAVGVAVLAYDCAEFKNAITDGVNGFLYHDNFMEKLEYIYNNRNVLKSVSEKVYNDIVRNHSTQCGIPQQLTEWLDNY